MIKNIFLLSVLILFPSFANASIAMNSHVCEIKAVVGAVNVRKERVHIPIMARYETRKYTDVSLNLISVELIEEHFMGECSIDGLPKVFQLRENGIFQKKPKEGQCLKAKTQFSGADTITGQWLYDVEILSEEECVVVDNE